MQAQDLTADLQQQVKQARHSGSSLQIVGGNTKAFYGGACLAQQRLNLAPHRGVIDYEPSELVITARAGTQLTVLGELLAQHQQMLGFEPPRLGGEQATLGGTLACGFSGPRRPYAGSARDFTLGCKILNGEAELLNFGGRVMKNVAGFDVSRLMVGALGTLGVLLEASLKVMPMPEFEVTLGYEMTEQLALSQMATLSAKPWPITGLAYDGARLKLRLSGAKTAVLATARQLGGEIDQNGTQFWNDLNEQRLTFFQGSGNLWRLSMAPATPVLGFAGQCLIDWGGALRWVKTEMPAAAIHAALTKMGGYAVCFRADDKTDWIRLDPKLNSLQQKIRAAFDPAGLFNPGRMSFNVN